MVFLHSCGPISSAEPANLMAGLPWGVRAALLMTETPKMKVGHLLGASRLNSPCYQ